MAKETIYLQYARKLVASFMIGNIDLNQALKLAEISIDHTISILTKLKGAEAMNQLGFLLVVKNEIDNVDAPF